MPPTVESAPPRGAPNSSEPVPVASLGLAGLRELDALQRDAQATLPSLAGGSSGEPVVSAEFADLLQDADTLSVLSVLSMAIDDGNRPVMRYCAQVLHDRLRRAGKETP